MAILLLSTEACHLCELAQQVLGQVFSQPQMQALAQEKGFDIYLQDIIDQPQWLALYAEKIPVLLDEDSGMILEWPFDAAKSAAWFEKLPRATGSETA